MSWGNNHSWDEVEPLSREDYYIYESLCDEWENYEWENVRYVNNIDELGDDDEAEEGVEGK